MWEEIFRAMGQCLGIICTGFVIKIIDDLLDEDGYNEVGNKRLIALFLPYVLLLFSLAVMLAHQYAIALFLASYIVGMFHDYEQYLPFGLTAWKESIVVGIIGLIFLKETMLFALIIIFTVQLLDDYIDFAIDQNTGQKNFVFRFGRFEVFIMIMLGIIVSFWLRPLTAVFVFFGVFCVNFISSRVIYCFPLRRDK